MGNTAVKPVKDLGLVKPFAEGAGDVSGIPLNALVGDAGIGDVASSAAPKNDQPTAEMLNVRAVQDPQLRALLAVDLAALRRATEAQDNRLSLVHLSPILEGLVADYILPRRKEFGFSGTPDGWNLKEFLIKRFSDRLSAGDRGILHHVFNSHKLLRPIDQYMAPMVVTPSTVQQHMEFVRDVAQELGYAGASPSDASETPGSGYRDAVVPKGPMN